MPEGGLPARAGSPELTHPAVTAPHGDHFKPQNRPAFASKSHTVQIVNAFTGRPFD
jgi:hypothetical protein